MGGNPTLDRAVQEFIEIRKKVNDCILFLKKNGEPGKSYEGAWEIQFDIPDAIEDPDAIVPMEYCKITLFSYLICPYSRHCEWRGKTFADAVERCRSDVESWIKTEYDRYE